MSRHVPGVPLPLPPRLNLDLEKGLVFDSDTGKRIGVVIAFEHVREHHPCPPYKDAQMGYVDDNLKITIGTGNEMEHQIQFTFVKPRIPS